MPSRGCPCMGGIGSHGAGIITIPFGTLVTCISSTARTPIAPHRDVACFHLTPPYNVIIGIADMNEPGGWCVNKASPAARVLFPGAYAGSDLQPRMAHAAAPLPPLPQSRVFSGRPVGAAAHHLANHGRLGAASHAG